MNTIERILSLLNGGLIINFGQSAVSVSDARRGCSLVAFEIERSEGAVESAMAAGERYLREDSGATEERALAAIIQGEV